MNGNGNKLKQGMKAGNMYAVKIIITLTQDGRVSVAGFPNNLHQAMGLIDAAKTAVVKHFIEKANAGNLDENGNINERIIKPEILIPQ